MIMAAYLFDSCRLFCEGARIILGSAEFDVAGVGETLGDIRLRLSDLAAPEPGSMLLVVLGALAGTGILASLDLVLALQPEARVVILADRYDQAEAITAMERGAKAYLHKNLSAESFIKALQLVSEDCSVISGWPVGTARRKVEPAPPVMPAASEDAPVTISAGPSNGIRALSPREMAILRMLTDGAPNKQIARSLAITESTVKVHIKTILRKIHVRNRTQAAIRAMAEPGLMMSPPAGDRLYDHHA